jgi:hypothetical protein
MSVDTTGVINYPLQSAFSAYKDATASNVTGDSTTYTCTYATEIFDQNSDFDGTSTFTAPVNGRYYLCGAMSISGFTSSHTNSLIQIITSNRGYECIVVNMYVVREAADYINIPFHAFADMDAADTATIQMSVSGGTKVVDVNSGTQTRFAGWLVC